MRQTMRFREPVTRFPDAESLNKRAAEGWKITSLELKAACLVCAPLLLDATDGKLTP